jgi:2-amino-4-hydroxy-6-hydroxymethyldihydropteridine diphosphokinase
MTIPDAVRCFIGLGSNLRDPLKQLKEAIEALEKLDNCRLIKVSPLYLSKPMGPQDQPDYVNAVAELQTWLSPHALLDQLQQIESHHGRERKGERWGPRTLDLDLLLYGQQQIQEPRLTVPHNGIAQRNFVLYPLTDLVGDDFVIPGHARLADLLSHCEKGDLVRIA